MTSTFLGFNFNSNEFDRNAIVSTYEATECVIKQMEANPNTALHNHDGNKYGEFLFNQSTKTAVYLKFVINLAKRRFVCKRNRSYENVHDFAYRTTTTSVGRNAIHYFLNQPQFKGFDLVVPVGSHIHEACLFVRKDGGGMTIIYYNPNYSGKTQGTQYSKVMIELVKSLGQSVTNIKTYYSRYGNPAGKCSVLVWKEIFNHVIDGKSPFRNPNLKLEEYNLLKTTFSAKKYHKKAEESDKECDKETDEGSDEEWSEETGIKSNKELDKKSGKILEGGQYVYNHWDMFDNLNQLLTEFGATDEDARIIDARAITNHLQPAYN